MSQEPKEKKQYTVDAWANQATGVGVLGKDSQASTRFYKSNQISCAELSNIYDDDGIGSRIINLPSDDMFRQGI